MSKHAYSAPKIEEEPKKAEPKAPVAKGTHLRRANYIVTITLNPAEIEMDPATSQEEFEKYQLEKLTDVLRKAEYVPEATRIEVHTTF